MLIKAEQRYLRMSPRKLRLVVRGVKDVKDPTKLSAYLKFINKRAARPILKVVKQALANAKHNKNLSEDNLYVKEIQIGEGPKYKRIRAGGRGMAKPILKRTSHIRVILETKDDMKGGKSAKPSETIRETTQNQA